MKGDGRGENGNVLIFHGKESIHTVENRNMVDYFYKLKS